jgi:transposase
MEAVYERCAGLDVHKRTVVACTIVPGEGRRVVKEVHTFETTTDDLEALASWLEAAGCTHVAMESTGVYWQPVWNLLEDRFVLLLVNARHVKAVPGRKTDVRDCEWLADLLRHGLLRPSFVPDRPQRELRELVRYRTALVREHTDAVNRLQKTLEGANIKLGDVASNVVGASGRAMLAALVGGTTDPMALAELARGRLREKIPQLQRALAGQFRPHHRFLVAQQLAHIDSLDGLLEQLDQEVADRSRPFETAIALLDTIPGVARRTAEIIIAEIGADVAAFPSAGHLASWAGLCPGNHESAGKRYSGRTRHGNPWLRSALVQAARGAAHKRDGYFAAQYRRFVVRRGKQKAAVAVAHSILVVAWHLLTRGDTYQELGGDYFDRRDRERLERRLVKQLRGLGYDVQLQPAAKVA